MTYRVIECSVAEVDTHLYTDAEESCDEVIALEYTLLLQLWVGGGGGGREGKRGGGKERGKERGKGERQGVRRNSLSTHCHTNQKYTTVPK